MSKENTLNMLDTLESNLKDDAKLMVLADARRESLGLSSGYAVAFKELETEMLKCVQVVRESLDDNVETAHSTEFLAESFAKGSEITNGLDALAVKAKQLLGLTKSEI